MNLFRCDKISFKKVSALPAAAFLFLILFVNLKSYSQCTCSPVSVFPSVVNGINVSETFTGDVQSYGSVGTYCGIDAGPSWIGQNGPFSQTFTFSTPVNNLEVAINASNFGEDFTFSVNNGVLTSTQSCGTCPYIQSGNVFSTPNGPLGAGIITLNSTIPYTQVTISGPGGGGTNGSLMGLCSVALNNPCSGTPISANFSSNSVCFNTAPIQFSDLSTNNTSWSWNFGDSGTSALQNPSHNYTTCGTFNCKLVVTGSTGCKDSVTKTVIVNCLPTADFGFTNACLNHSISFSDSSTVSGGIITDRSWDFGDGTPHSIVQNPTHSYAGTGTYFVSLIVTSGSGCKDTITKTTTVHSLPIAQYSTADVCDGTSVHFTDLSAIPSPDIIQTRGWNFGDGTPIYNNPTASHPYSAPGLYTVQLLVISNFGCSDSITKTVIVHPNPISNFNNTSVCRNNSTQFTDSTFTAMGTISSRLWDFGDASPLNNTTSPSHIYANSGTYNVTLIANNSLGCADTITKPVQVFYNPVTGFTFNNICFGDTIQFNDTSFVDNSTSIASYLWVFGDLGPTSSLQNPNHYYPGSAVYSVTLVTTTIDGCTNAAINSVKAFDAPSSVCSFSNTCLFDSALFFNSSTNPTMGNTAAWSWNFGDGSVLNTTVWSPGHQYANPGSYQLTLITYSSNLGCSDTLQDSIIVFPMPTANFSFTNVCLDQAMNFNDSSIAASGVIAGRTWNFGDGSPTASGQNPSHNYSAPGTFAVSLIVTTSNGCLGSITKNVVVHPMPAAQFNKINVCDGSLVPFNDLSSILITDTIQSWAWNFGDGSPVFNNQDTSHLYAAGGAYSVQLLVVSNFGCKDSISKTVIVNPNPAVNFTVSDTSGCETLCVSFQNLSSITSGVNAAVSWNFGSGTGSSNSQNPEYCYSNDSVYAANFFNVSLTVVSDSGCISTLSKNNYITVYPNPNAVFSVQPETASISDPVISITDLSAGADFWNWNFGDGSDTAYAINQLTHTYADTGTYQITLITTTQFNCVDTAYHTIIIEPEFLFYIPNTFSPNDDGINETFSGKGIFISKYEMMIFDRWGNLIFYTDDINRPWDGSSNHGTEISQQDVYIYSIKITDYKKRKHNYKGIVTLVK